MWEHVNIHSREVHISRCQNSIVWICLKTVVLPHTLFGYSHTHPRTLRILYAPSTHSFHFRRHIIYLLFWFWCPSIHVRTDFMPFHQITRYDNSVIVISQDTVQCIYCIGHVPWQYSVLQSFFSLDQSTLQRWRQSALSTQICLLPHKWRPRKTLQTATAGGKWLVPWAATLA